MTDNRLEAKLADYLERKMREGFQVDEDLIAPAADSCGDESDEETEVIEQVAARVLLDVRAKLRIEQASWPAITDCDRLDAAFEKLNAAGILARHDWACCGNCGKTEIFDEFERLDGYIGDQPIIGYTFYHQQSTESAAEGAGLYLYWSSTEGARDEKTYESQSIAVAQAICDALRAEGLTVSWDGSYGRAIGIDLDWKRRLPPARFVGDSSIGEC